MKGKQVLWGQVGECLQALMWSSCIPSITTPPSSISTCPNNQARVVKAWVKSMCMPGQPALSRLNVQGIHLCHQMWRPPSCTGCTFTVIPCLRGARFSTLNTRFLGGTADRNLLDRYRTTGAKLW